MYIHTYIGCILLKHLFKFIKCGISTSIIFFYSIIINKSNIYFFFWQFCSAISTIQAPLISTRASPTQSNNKLYNSHMKNIKCKEKSMNLRRQISSRSVDIFILFVNIEHPYITKHFFSFLHRIGVSECECVCVYKCMNRQLKPIFTKYCLSVRWWVNVRVYQHSL